MAALAPNKRDDVAARKKKQKTMRHDTVKSALLRSLKPGFKIIREVVEDAVAAITHISVEGSRFINYFVLRRISEGETVPEIDQTFVRRCFSLFWEESLVRHSLEIDQDNVISASWQSYSAVRGELPRASFEGSGFGQILSYAAKEYLSAFQMHVTSNFYWRLFDMVERHIEEALAPTDVRRALRRKASYEMVSWIINDHDEDINGNVVEAKQYILQEALGIEDEDYEYDDVNKIVSVSEDLVSFCDYTRTVYGDVIPVRNYYSSTEWYKLLPWLYQINRENARHAAEHGNRNDPVRPARLFTLAPISTFEAKFVTIDNRVLYHLLKRMNQADLPPTSTAFNIDADQWWTKVFNVNAVLRQGNPSYEFNRYVKTDGVAVNFVCARPKTEEELVDPDEEQVEDEMGIPRKKKKPWATPFSEWPDQETVQDHLVTGVDPGRRDIVTAVYPMPPAAAVGGGGGAGPGPVLPPSEAYVAPSRKRKARNRRSRRGQKKRKRRHGGRLKAERNAKGEVVVNVSMAAWRSAAGNKRAEAQSTTWMKKTIFHIPAQNELAASQISLWDAMEAIPTPKVSTATDFLEQHCRYVCTWLHRILAHKVGRRKVRRLRFQSYMQKQAAMDALCHRLSGGRGREAVVVWGATTCSKGFRHYPGPIKALRRRLELHTRVVVLHEHFTSQRCSKCAFGPQENLEHGENRDDKLKCGKCGNSLGRRRSDNIYGVKWCSHRNCMTRWNRDVNAARNMRLIFLAMLRNNKVRPAPFKHPGALDSEVNG